MAGSLAVSTQHTPGRWCCWSSSWWPSSRPSSRSSSSTISTRGRLLSCGEGSRTPMQPTHPTSLRWSLRAQTNQNGYTHRNRDTNTHRVHKRTVNNTQRTHVGRRETVNYYAARATSLRMFRERMYSKIYKICLYLPTLSTKNQQLLRSF